MKRTLIISTAVLVALSACGGLAAAPAQRSMDFAEPSAPMLEAPAESFAAEVMESSTGDTAGFSGEPAQAERLVIQNADLGIVVADPESKLDEIGEMAEEMGGYVVSKNVYQTTTSTNLQVPEGSITVRVPAERLEEALAQIKAEVVEVQNESRSGQDVTREYVDLQSRLKTHEQAAEQLSAILEEKTESEEVIEVFNQLVYHREQIEILKGQINYYEEAAAMSAVSVRVIAEESIQPLEIGGWKPAGAARDALQTLINFTQGFVEFLIWLVILILPAGALILALLWVLWRLVRAVWRRVNPRAAKPASKDKAEK